MLINAPAKDALLDGNEDRESLDLIRQLLLSTDRQNVEDAHRRLDQIEKRLNDRVARSKDISEVIVPVLRKNLSNEQDLKEVLQPVLVEQFHQTARDNPDAMAEALFPILGPAVRKMIGNLISPDKKSRKRTYRLEQLLLIDKESGLPLCQVSSDAVVSQDADMVSGMLSAIQSFVHDAFSADEFDGLNTLQVGELSVWIEWGPASVLAAVVRGAPPQSLREAMQVYLEQVHRDYGDALSNYNGDASKIEHLKPDLSSLLDNHDGSLKNRVRNLSPNLQRWMLGGAVALLLVLFWFAYAINDSRQWRSYVEQLDAIPGVVVIQHERHFRDYRITGLKDPLAIIPDSLLKNANLNPDYVVHRFEAYQALSPVFMLERLKSVIEIPNGVSLKLQNSVLQVSGDIDYRWLQSVRQYVESVVGIDRVVYSGS